MKIRNYDIQVNWEFIKWTYNGILELIRLWILILLITLIPYLLGVLLYNNVWGLATPQPGTPDAFIMPLVYWAIGTANLLGLLLVGAWVWSAVVITKQ